ncbi:ribonuclease P protein component 1 [Halobellus sp. EA9]|uniref:ribonuclease P protein component 1 n=1 Tax=Halobellus sp. EA9 TaxID=3421647 RepID=UPI003EBB1E21
MALTPETLTRHELNGLRVAVVDAPNPDLVGICGRVVVETMQTLHVDVSDCDADAEAAESAAAASARVKQVPKQGSTLEFELPASDAASDDPSGGGDARGRGSDEHERGDERERTDEAADAAKASGTASELRSDTAGGFDAGQSGRCEGAAYVTVDGTRLLSRPALRTEKAGDTLWR